MLKVMDDRKIKKSYTNGEITVFWEPAKCLHAMRCVKGLPQVFDVRKRPWVTIGGDSSQEIARVIDTCPSKALTYEWN